jgi:hypothetical protein
MELIIQQLVIKFDIVKNILQKSDACDQLLLDFNKIENTFTAYISPIYIGLGKIDKFKIQDISHYLLAEDVSNELNYIIHKVKSILKQNNIDIDENKINNNETKNNRSKKTNDSNMFSKKKLKKDFDLQYLFNIFPWNLNIPGNVSNVNYSKCEICNSIMTIDSNKSELKCNDCGMIKELIGTIFDDLQFYNQEGQKTKSGTFNPNRHFQFWWSHILAKESEEELGDKKDPDNIYGEKVLKQIKNIIIRDRKILQLLTVNDIRTILREIDKTDLNKNVPLILKKLTGIGPPHIPDNITMKVENLFTKAIEIGEKIKHNKRINRNYYPYYIYRIIESITTDSDTELRRVLYYIYIQSKETVESDDLNWEKICEELKEIKYKPTDRALGLQYSKI